MAFYDTEDFWLKRAEQARTLAARMSQSDTSRMMLCVAEDYDTLARLAKERAAIMARLDLLEDLKESPQD